MAQGFPWRFDGSGESWGHLAIWEAVTTGNPSQKGAFDDEERDCERCGNPIPSGRLEVLPYTRLCIECSEAIGGDYKTFVIPENTGKPGSLKRNYGSWKVKRKLRVITPLQKK
jgi:Prokaryotic dksA/traR C4-type zinc finger